ncbi:MAG: glycosyltransferase involved in cell wall biosynthesis [Alteromonas macleodii]|jgi:glycosyltransferase involved in cell wall biosynthesis
MLNTMEYDTTFSVVIPLFNKAKNLDRAIASVQSAILNRNIEIIVVDDGSTDGSGELLEHHALSDSRVRAIHQGNAGASFARNTGINASNSDFILLLDADDFWLNGHLDVIEEMIQLRPNSALHAAAYAKNSGGKIIEQDFYCTPKNKSGILHAYFLSMSYGAMPVSASSVCIPRLTVSKIGGFDLGKTHGEDRIYWAKCALHGDVNWSPKVSAIYDIDADHRSTTTWTPAKASAYLNFLKKSRNDLLDLPYSPTTDELSKMLQENILSEMFYLAQNCRAKGFTEEAKILENDPLVNGYVPSAPIRI